MKLSKKAVAALKRAFCTDDCSMRLTRMYAVGCQELKGNELAEYIPRSQGGYDVALTTKGVEEAERRWSETAKQREEVESDG